MKHVREETAGKITTVTCSPLRWQVRALEPDRSGLQSLAQTSHVALGLPIILKLQFLSP